MKFGSVCSGIESASVAWEPLGMSAAWFAEIEAFPSAVLAHHWPDVENHGDMTKLPAMILRGSIEAPEILVGGTPCQAFSIAGKRESLDDERGQLTLSYVEIANAIDHVRGAGKECVTVWENVPGVLNTKDNAFGCFLAALVGESEPLQPAGGKWTNAGCVYGPQRTAAWRILDAQYFGVAQRRRRVFVVASSRNGFDPAAVLFEREGVRRDSAPSREAGEGFAPSVSPCLRANSNTANRLDMEAHVATTFDFQPSGEYGESPVAATLSARDYKSAKDLVLAFSCKDNGRDASEDISPTLRAMGGDKANGGGQMAVAFAQNSRNELRLEGGDGQSVGALSSSNSAKPGQGVPAIASASAVRRLTPVECERLQGFPDDHTRIAWRNKPADQCPDGPRYKAIGNSKAVPVVRWIGERLMREAK